jgi:cytochrome oxidase Cu insertion factor (SCO1/SenC/PrrC family)
MANKDKKAGSLKLVFALGLLFGPALILILISTRGCQHKFKKLDDYGVVPEYSFTDIQGNTYTKESFKNQIVLFTTIQKSCPDTCAIAMWHLDQLIYQTLKENKKKLHHVKLVSILTDGQGNPSNDLDQINFTLKDQVEGYDPSIWIVVKGDAKSLYNMKHNGQTLLQQDMKYFGNEAFQELMMLQDKAGHLRMVLPGKTESTIRTMRDHMALLEKEYDQKAARQKK